MSLGGSIIIPEKKHDTFLLQFRKILQKHYATHQFVIVCGGGSIARAYQTVLKEEHKSVRALSQAGIRATRMNAQFVMQVFGKEANETLPLTMKDVASHLKKNKVVICGSLRFAENETSDGTAAKLAGYLKAAFVNLTNVPGLYTSDPRKNPKAHMITHEDWKSFEHRAKKIHYKPGQHFVLDQKAAERIRQKKITTYIIGKDAQNLNALISGKRFKGTTIGLFHE